MCDVGVRLLSGIRQRRHRVLSVYRATWRVRFLVKKSIGVDPVIPDAASH